MNNEIFKSDLANAKIIYEDYIHFHIIPNDRPDAVLAVVMLTFKNDKKGYLVVRTGYPDEETIVMIPPVEFENNDGEHRVTSMYQTSDRLLPLICDMLNKIENRKEN